MHILNTGKLVVFLTLVTDNGYLVADLLAVLAEFIQQKVLHEVRLHCIACRTVADVVVNFVMPFDHPRYLRLIGIGFQHMVFPLGGNSHKQRGFEVCRRGGLERRVGITYQCPIIVQTQHFTVMDVLFLKDCPLVDRVIHVFTLEATFAHSTTNLCNLSLRVVLPPSGETVLVECIYDSMVKVLIFRNGTDDRRFSDSVSNNRQPSSAHRHRSEQGRQ